MTKNPDGIIIAYMSVLKFITKLFFSIVVKTQITTIRKEKTLIYVTTKRRARLARH